MNQEVGRYQLQQELKRDATGSVYQALDLRLSREVVIRSFRLAQPTVSEDVSTPNRDRLLEDARAAQLLSHPHIVATYDAFQHDDAVYIVVEYVDGLSLEELSREGKLPAREQLSPLLQQLASALDYAHRNGVIHREIRPANILLTKAQPGSESIAKIAGFGIAKFVSFDMTQNDSMANAPDYMSPEQIQDTTVDGHSDQFSFAAVVYELLTGTKPFSANQPSALFYAICKQDPPAANQLNSALNDATAKVLQRALMKDPGQRFASCGEFVGALSIALAEAPAPPAQPVRTSPVITIPDTPPPVTLAEIPVDAPYEVPTRVRRHREDDLLESETSRPRSSGAQKLLLIVAMFFAIGAAIILIVVSNSGPAVPVQVLDTRSGPVTPPPEGMEVKNRSPRSPTQTTTLHVPLDKRHTESTATQIRSSTGLPAPIAPTPARSVITGVELLTEPPGARMVVDARPDLSCNSPCTLNMPNGRHTVTAELAGFNLGRRIFNVPEEESLFVSLGKSMGVLVVTSNQSGCAVLVDGRPSGYTPATLHLTAGSHRIAVVSRSTRHEETVQVQTDGFDVEKFICQ